MQIRNCLLTLAVFSLFFSGYATAGKYNSILSIGDKMPTFSDLPGTDGSRLSSADLKESVIVLVSLANHCPWVKGLDAGLVEVAQKFSGKDVRIVGFSVNHNDGDRLPAMKKHAKKVGYDFSYIYDESQELGRKLGATRTPEYFVFGKDRTLKYTGLLHNSPARMTSSGKIKYVNGEPSIFYVDNAINALLGGLAVNTPETRAHGCSVKYEKKS